MTKEELEKKCSELRKTAIAVDRAIEAGKRRKTQERLSSDESKAERKEADEAKEKHVLFKSIEEIIANGTPYDKACAILSHYDTKHLWGAASLTDEQLQQIRNSLRTPEDIAAYMEYLKVYDKLRKYQKNLAYTFKMFQLEASLLQNLLTKWDNYEQQANLLSILYGSLKCTGGHSDMAYSLTGRTEDMKELDTTNPEALLQEINNLNDNKGDVRYIAVGDDVKADIDFEGGLYSQIHKQATSTAKKLSWVKGYIEVVMGYILDNGFLGLMPNAMEMTIDNVQDERFIRSLTKEQGYFRSTLNAKKIDRGEPVTPEEEHKAVYPDYYEVEADKEVVEDCKLQLEQD